MEVTSRYGGAIRYIQARWPNYLLGYGGAAILVAIVIGSSLSRGWYAFVALAIAAAIVLVYLSTASIWAAHQLYDGGVICDRVFELGQVRSQDVLVTISPGLQTLALEASKRMTTGRVIVVDIYHPELTPGGTLARSSQLVRRPEPDARLSWRDGAIHLLPMPDNSVETIILLETLSTLWQQGDRSRLLREIKRILLPGGRLIVGERTRTAANFLVLGPGAMRLRPAGYWRRLMKEAGLEAGRPVSMKDLLFLWSAEKSPLSGQQPLPLTF